MEAPRSLPSTAVHHGLAQPFTPVLCRRSQLPYAADHHGLVPPFTTAQLPLSLWQHMPAGGSVRHIRMPSSKSSLATAAALIHTR